MGRCDRPDCPGDPRTGGCLRPGDGQRRSWPALHRARNRQPDQRHGAGTEPGWAVSRRAANRPDPGIGYQRSLRHHLRPYLGLVAAEIGAADRQDRPAAGRTAGVQQAAGVREQENQQQRIVQSAGPDRPGSPACRAGDHRRARCRRGGHFSFGWIGATSHID